MAECGFNTKLFGGFHKKQVLEYIDNAHAQFDEVTRTLNEEIEKGKQENRALAARVQELHAENEKSAAELSALLEQQKQLQDDLSEKDAALKNTKEQLNRANFAMQSMQVKCEKFDKISTQVNELIGEAKKMAANIVANAKQEAAGIVAEAENRSADIKQTTDALSAQVTDQILTVTDDVRRMKAEIAVMQRQADQKLADLEAMLASAQRRLSAKSAYTAKPAEPETFEPSEALKTFF